MKFLKNIFNPDHIIKKKNNSLKKKDQSINEVTNTLKPILKGNINLQNDLIDIKPDNPQFAKSFSSF